MRATFCLPSGPDRTGIDVDHAMANLPLAEVRAVKALAPADSIHMTDAQILRSVTENRIEHAICNWCYANGDTPLFFCTKCHCTWYCSPLCQQRDAALHDKWCCVTEAEADQGPRKLVGLDVDLVAYSSHMDVNTQVRQHESALARIEMDKTRGNTAYKFGRFDEALAYFTRAIRVPQSIGDINLFSPLLRACWLDRSRAYGAMGLWHLAYTNIKSFETMGGKLTAALDLRTRLRAEVMMRMYEEALGTCDEILQAHDVTAPLRTEITKAIDRIKKSKQQQQQHPQQVERPYTPCVLDFYANMRKPVSMEDYVTRSNRDIAQFARIKSSGDGMIVHPDSAHRKDRTLFMEAPLAHGTVLDDRCAGCFMQTPTVPCKGNCGLLYCNKSCRDRMARFHTWQCDVEMQKRIAHVRALTKRDPIGDEIEAHMALAIIAMLDKFARDKNILEDQAFLHLAPVFHGPTTRGVHRTGIRDGWKQYQRIVWALQLNQAWFDYYTFDYMRSVLMRNAQALHAGPAVHAPGGPSDGPTVGIAVYQLQRFFRHSCEPNVKLAISASRAFMFVVAQRDLMPCEELRVSYIKNLDVSLEERTAQLRAEGIKCCDCGKCQRQFIEQMREHDMLADQGQAFSAVGMFKERLSTMRDD